MKRVLICLCMVFLLAAGVGTVFRASADDLWIGIDSFTDLDPNAWYMKQGAIQYAIDHKLTNGVSKTQFAPDATMTRAQLATMLYRMTGQPTVSGLPAPSFPDYADGVWWSDAIRWAVSKGIIRGNAAPGGGLRLDCDQTVTRLQMITMLYRYADDIRGYDMGSKYLPDFTAFVDGAQVGYSGSEMMWAIAEGYIEGTKTDVGIYLAPNQGMTRAQAVAVLMRFMQDAHSPALPTDVVIWSFLKGKGLSDYAAAGIMGNLFAESSLRPNNLQNSYEAKLGCTDDGYTDAVDRGTYSKDQFIHDSAGYGLAQWTFWSRKEGLYNLSKARGISICDLQLQIDYLYSEPEFKAILTELSKSNSVREASDIVLIRYERPADQSESVKKKRAEFCTTYYNKFAGK